jgi:hypothetical protein
LDLPKIVTDIGILIETLETYCFQICRYPILKPETLRQGDDVIDIVRLITARHGHVLRDLGDMEQPLVAWRNCVELVSVHDRRSQKWLRPLLLVTYRRGGRPAKVIVLSAPFALTELTPTKWSSTIRPSRTVSVPSTSRTNVQSCASARR